MRRPTEMRSTGRELTRAGGSPVLADWAAEAAAISEAAVFVVPVGQGQLAALLCPDPLEHCRGATRGQPHSWTDTRGHPLR